jgi:hypothetical protein
VVFDPLGRKQNTYLSGPIGVRDIIISLPPSKREEFLSYLSHSDRVIRVE